MTGLTKEYFDQEAAKLATAESLDELARMVGKGFDGTDEKLAEIAEKLDVRGELDNLKHELQDMKGKLEHALHVKL